MTEIYLDNNATTRLAPDVLDAMLPFLKQDHGNPSSIHAAGRRAKDAVSRARESIAASLGVTDREIYFTGSGSESDNLAIRGACLARPNRPHVIGSRSEHAAVLNTLHALHTESGIAVDLIPVDSEGVVARDALRSALNDKTALVTVQMANNETGTVQPISEIAPLAHEHGALLHTDATQAIGKIPVSVDTVGCDLLTFAPHKFFGPKGVGVLVIRKGTAIRPILYGGHQERDLRPGTENVPGIVGCAKALELAVGGMEQNEARQRALCERLQKGLAGQLSGITRNGPGTEGRLPNTLNLSFADLDGEALLHNLDLAGIQVSTGSACASGSPEPSHVLIAMGRTPQQAQASVRFSLSPETTEEQIDTVLQLLPPIIHRLRSQRTF